MAKVSKAAPAAIPSNLTATPVSHSYRAYRVDTYAWQAYKLTLFSDGTTKEEPVFKADLLEIVLRRIGEVVRAEGQIDFMNAKKAGVK